MGRAKGLELRFFHFEDFHDGMDGMDDEGLAYPGWWVGD